MRKILMTFTLILSALFANAQIATENSKIFDNVYFGVEVGASTPLNMNSVFPVNPIAGLKLGKELTPVVGLELEGQVFINDNNIDRWTSTFIKGTNLEVNNTININNLLAGYKGTPRIFEVKTNTGLGWLHKWNSGGDNALTAKTGLDFLFNIGNKKAHTLAISPAIYWNVYDNGKFQFNKNNAQLALFASYLYHFKTSNGTRHFKTYDVGAMINEIDRLNDELAKKPKEVQITKYVNTIETVTKIIPSTFVIQFAQNSSVLSNEAKEILDEVKGKVKVVAYASPEGTNEYNQRLSEKRAAVITDYLTNRNIKVISFRGLGCINKNSNRIGIVEIMTAE